MRSRAGLFFFVIGGIVFALLASCLDASPAHAAGDLPALADDPVRSASRAEVDALAREVETMPDGRTRALTDLFLGQLYAARFDAPDRAAVHFRRVTTSAFVASDPLTRRMAEGGLVDALLRVGARGEARAVANRSGDAELGRRVDIVVRRHALHVASIMALLLFASLATVSIAVATKRRSLKSATRTLPRFGQLALGFAAWLGAAGSILAANYDAGSPLPFLALAVIVVPIALLARAWALVGRRAAWARTGRAICAANAALASAFLVLEAVDASWLSGFGL